MSSSITFREDVSATVWNSTFKIILRKLEECSSVNKTATSILRENLIAAPIGSLNLKSLSAEELAGFIQLLSGLRDETERITEEWNLPQQRAQFPIDLESTIKKAQQVAESL